VRSLGVGPSAPGLEDPRVAATTSAHVALRVARAPRRYRADLRPLQGDVGPWPEEQSRSRRSKPLATDTNGCPPPWRDRQ
jgi:hypothetical protein